MGTVDAYFEGLVMRVTGEGSQDTPDGFDTLLEQLNTASIEEIRSGLSRLWPFMRHIRREDAWMEYLPSLWRVDPPNAAREEIVNYLFPDVQLSDISRQRDPLATERASAVGSQDDTKVRGTVRQLLEEISKNEDPLSKYLPSELDVTGPLRTYSASDAQHNFSLVRTELWHISAAVQDRMQTSVQFWAILGPIIDAMRCESAGAAAKIHQARYRYALRRCLAGQGDLYDHWMLVKQRGRFRHLEESRRRAVSQNFRRLISTAHPSDVDEFFRALDFDEFELPEKRLSLLIDSDRMWKSLLRRRDVTRAILARAGYYCWTTAKHGSPRTLAAICVEHDRSFRYPFVEFMFMPLWQAARGSARAGEWELALDCMNRALLIIADGAEDCTGRDVEAREEARAAIEAFHFEDAFVRELDERSSRRPVASALRFYLHLALARLNTVDGPISRLHLVLERLGRRLKVDRFSAELSLRDALSEALWRQLQARTRECLLAGESIWSIVRFRDEATTVGIGVAYRNALDYEWRDRIGLRVAQSRGMSAKELGFGGIVAWAEEKINTGTVNEIALVLGPDTRLADAKLLAKAREVSKRYLTADAHGGLTRGECEALRRCLLDEGWLKIFLGAVQDT